MFFIYTNVLYISLFVNIISSYSKVDLCCLLILFGLALIIVIINIIFFYFHCLLLSLCHASEKLLFFTSKLLVLNPRCIGQRKYRPKKCVGWPFHKLDLRSWLWYPSWQKFLCMHDKMKKVCPLMIGCKVVPIIPVGTPCGNNVFTTSKRRRHRFD